MNSLIQQLYHIPAFSSGLLSIADSLEDSGERGPNIGDSDPQNNGTDGGNDPALASAALDGGYGGGGGDGALVAAKESATGPSSDEKFFFQLQVMFGYLRLSEKRFYDTLSFCKVGDLPYSHLCSILDAHLCVDPLLASPPSAVGAALLNRPPCSLSCLY